MTSTAGVEELERAVASEPDNAELHYLLGAELAQSREYDRAVVEIGKALTLAPDLHYARFQLGLLHLTMAHPSTAMTVWAPLEQIPGDKVPLKLFKRGLEALIEDRFADCVELLAYGINLNTDNAALAADMQKIIDRVRPQLADGHAVTPADSPQGAVQGQASVWTDFSKYGNPDPTRH